MAIELQTGLPGHGKTLYSLWRVRKWAETDGRQVYYNGISDLCIPGWVELEKPESWMECPARSIVVIDEAQRAFRPRANGSAVPKHVADLETHRHLGIDLVFITQHPMLLDGNVRKLVDTHRHAIRPFGSKHAVVHKWPGVRDQPDKPAARKESIKEQFKYPAEVFTWYKSAEAHTVKRSIPLKFMLFWLLPLLLIAAVVGMYFWTQSKIHPKPESAPATPATTTAQHVALASSSAPSPPPPDWFEAQRPRVPGLPHTAPVYDQITQPVEAPVPAACVDMKSKGCRCYTQQGTRMEVPDELCRSIVERGFFIAWKQPDRAADIRLSSQPMQQAMAQPDPYVIAAPEPAQTSFRSGGRVSAALKR